MMSASTLTMGVLASVVAFCASAACAQTAGPSIYLDQSADRTDRLIAGARTERTLTLYTSMATTESGPLAAAFERRYGVKVQIWRAASDTLLQRALIEARGGRSNLDVIETDGPDVEALAREGVVAQFVSPHFADLPAWALPQHRRWASDRANLWVTGYNTGKVKREELPNTLDGFIDPKWQGRLSLEATDADWMYGVISFVGEQAGRSFFQRLATLKPELRKSHVLVAQLLAAGELTVCLTAYSGNVDSIKAKGGPIDWAPIEPLIGRPQALALAAKAPHPNAALLFADFLLSRDGQKLLADLGRVPSSRTQTTLLDRHRFAIIDPIKWTDEASRWQDLWNQLFAK